MFGFMKSAPAAPPIKNDNEINNLYRYWRIHMILGIYVGYTIFYFTRKSFNFAMPAMLDELGMTKSDVGILTTLFYVTYGLSKFFSGILSDRSNPRYFMAFGLIATGVINIFFGLSSSLTVFAFLWFLNAVFQGWGWAPCSKVLTNWYSRSERGRWWSFASTSHNAGGGAIPMLVSFVIGITATWRYGLIVPGIIAIIAGFFVAWRLRDTPESMGLPSVGQWRNDKDEIAYQNKGQGLPMMTVLFRYVFTNPYIWMLAFCYVAVYIVRSGINDWGNLYLKEVQGYSLGEANFAVSAFEIGGFAGMLLAGWGSDLLFKGNRGPMNLIFAVGVFVSVLCLWLMPEVSYMWQALLFFFIGFFIFGPQMLIGIAAVEAAHKDAVGAANGFVGLFAYLGAALSGYPLALVMESYGWFGFFAVLSFSAVVTVLLLVPCILKGNKQHAQELEQVTA